MSGTEPGIAEIVAEVLDEHAVWRQKPIGGDVIYGYLCPCGFVWEMNSEYRQHVGQVVAERLQAAEVGACGAAGGEVGTGADAWVSGALRAKWRDAASGRLGDRLHEPSDGPWFDYNQRIVMLCDALDTAEARLHTAARARADLLEVIGAMEQERDELRTTVAQVESSRPGRTRCDEDSGSYGTCGCPTRCNLDAGHDGEHRANRQGVLTGWRGRL